MPFYAFCDRTRRLINHRFHLGYFRWLFEGRSFSHRDVVHVDGQVLDHRLLDPNGM